MATPKPAAVEETTVVPAIIAILASVAATIVALIAIGKFFFNRSVVVAVANATESNLVVHETNHTHGGSYQNPDQTIEAGKGSVYISGTKGKFFTGTEGYVIYDGMDIQLKVQTWDNPYVGSNSCDIQLWGPQAFHYALDKSCGSETPRQK